MHSLIHDQFTTSAWNTAGSDNAQDSKLIVCTWQIRFRYKHSGQWRSICSWRSCMCWAPTAWTTALERALTSSCRLPAPPLTPSCITSSCRFITVPLLPMYPCGVPLHDDIVQHYNLKYSLQGFVVLIPAPVLASYLAEDSALAFHLYIDYQYAVSTLSPMLMVPACSAPAPI